MLAATVGGGEEPTAEGPSVDQSSGDGAQESAREEAASPEQAPATPEEPPETLGDVSYEPYSPPAGGYETVVPSGNDWVVTPETEPSPGIRRTTVEGPRGLELWIDYTPDERARFRASDKQVESHREVAHHAFGTADVWNVTGGVSLCQTWPCVDYLMNDGEEGFAVLAEARIPPPPGRWPDELPRRSRRPRADPAHPSGRVPAVGDVPGPYLNGTPPSERSGSDPLATGSSPTVGSKRLRMLLTSRHPARAGGVGELRPAARPVRSSLDIHERPGAATKA